MHILVLILSFCSFLAAEECRYIHCRLSPRPSRPHPMDTSSSGNWAGYVASSQPYSVQKVSGSWVVPSVVPSGVDTACAIWVGIDGSGSNSVEQIGTSHDVNNGVASHYAWFEMFPQGSNNLVGFPVEVGDHISAFVLYVPLSQGLPVGSSLFILQITNNTKRVYTIVPSIVSYDVKRLSAEWIVEAPYMNGTLPLSSFGSVFLSNCTAEISNVSGPIDDIAWAWDNMNMVAPDGSPKALTSSLSVDGESFSVAWKHN